MPSPKPAPRHGMVLGKFMPPHKGHVLLIDFARHFVDDLVIVVGTLPGEPIPGALRYQWMQELFPSCTVLHLEKVLPPYPEEAPSVEVFWQLWRSSLLEILPRQVDYVFASEDYGARLASELGARYIPVDQPRGLVPVSGTAIRENPLKNWQHLPDIVRPYYLKRVCVFGPESCGKSTLARQLAAHFSTRWVPEFAQILLAQQQGKLREADIEIIARGQLAAENALARQAEKLLFCDTDLLTTVLWSRELFGSSSTWLETEAGRQSYDLTLL
ncbi:MAG: AAA family ATPase, partial [Candidatus Sericytochromatia bacterium]